MNIWVRSVWFNAVGALGIGVQLAAVWLLVDVAHVQYLLATTAAVGLAVGHNFTWRWCWTWRDRAETGSLTGAFVRFAAANGVLSLVGNLGMTATLVSGVRLNPVLANAVGMGVCGLLNIWLGDEVVFRRTQ